MICDIYVSSSKLLKECVEKFNRKPVIFTVYLKTQKQIYKFDK